MPLSRRVLVLLAPWVLLVLVAGPLLRLAPEAAIKFPALLFIVFEPSPALMPYCVAAGWLVYLGLAAVMLTRTSRRAFWYWWAGLVVLLVGNTGGVLFVLSALSALR